MFFRKRSVFSAACVLAMMACGLRGEERQAYLGCAADDLFAAEVWAKVGARDCVKCHKAGGDAEESKFVLRDPARRALAHP